MKTEVRPETDIKVIASRDDFLRFFGDGSVKIEHVLITPLGAEAMLELDTNNRRLVQRRVDRHIESLEDGEWYLSNDAITVDKNMVFGNGQHRLSAAKQSGHAIEVFLFTGANPESRKIMDTGAKRTLADALTMSGITGYTTSIASTAFLHYRYEHRALALTRSGVIGSKDRPGHDVMIKWIEDHPLIQEMVPYGMQTYLRLRGFNQTAAATFGVIAAELDKEQAVEFMERLAAGKGLEDGMPLYAFRRLLENVHSGMTTRGPRRQEWALAAAIKTWNYMRLDRQVQTINVRETEAFPEAI